MIRNALAGLGVFVLVVTFTPVVKWTARAMEDEWGGDRAEVLVVLGGSMLMPGNGPAAAMGDDTYLRCVYAGWVAKEKSFQRVVVTGGNGLAEAMARCLEANGIPRAEILEENAAESTEQNAVFTKAILTRVYGGALPRIAVLTSDYHSRRARLTFQHVGFASSSIPVPDAIKKSGSLVYRWSGCWTVMGEAGKLAYYKVSGKI